MMNSTFVYRLTNLNVPAYLMYTVSIFGDIHAIDNAGGLYRIHNSNITGVNPCLDGNKLAAHLEEEICTRRK